MTVGADLERLTRFSKLALPPTLRIHYDEIERWLKDHTNDRAFLFGRHVFFASEEDRVSFQMRWL